MTPKTSSTIQIVRVPVSERRRSSVDDENDSAVYYGPLPVLYVELIENKDRIRPELRKPLLTRRRTAVAAGLVGGTIASSSAQAGGSGDHQSTTTTIAGHSSADAEQTATDHAAKRLKLDDGSSIAAGGNTASGDATHKPPSLDELHAKGLTNIAGCAQPSTGRASIIHPIEDSEDAAKERDDLYFRYQVLKRMHPTADIPEMTICSDPKIMAQKYSVLTKRLSLDSSVESWKRYMIIAVMITEVVLGKMKFDMEGFAQQQIASMNTYDALLVELAEKTYVPEASKWPVELRLVAAMLGNIAMFAAAKMIARRTGFNFLEAINSAIGTSGRFITPPMPNSSSASSSSSATTAASSSPNVGAPSVSGTIPADKMMRAPQ